MAQAAPKVGSIIMIGKSKTELLVVESWNDVSEAHDGAYYADKFKTVPYGATYGGAPSKGFVNSDSVKEKTWTMDGWSMGGPNMVKLQDITVVGKTTVKKQVIVKYYHGARAESR